MNQEKMMISANKIWWFIEKFFNFLIVCIQTLFYCIMHPKKFFRLAFSFFSIVNEFYQSSHGHLRDFTLTKTYQALKSQPIFAHCDYFHADSTVTRPMETHVLATLTYYFKPKNIFEIGTYNGFTTLHFAYNSPSDCTVYTLDLPPDYNVEHMDKSSKYSYDDWLVVELSMAHIKERTYNGDRNSVKIKELFGDSATFDFSPYYGRMDLIFIDGSHSYEYIKSDTENAFRMLSQDGVIIWHDFDYIIHKDVFKYLNKLSQEREIYSITNTRFAVYGKRL